MDPYVFLKDNEKINTSYNYKKISNMYFKYDNEKLIGHRPIDGGQCEVIKTTKKWNQGGMIHGTKAFGDEKDYNININTTTTVMPKDIEEEFWNLSRECVNMEWPVQYESDITYNGIGR